VTGRKITPKNDLFLNCRTKSKLLLNKTLSNIPTVARQTADRQRGTTGEKRLSNGLKKTKHLEVEKQQKKFNKIEILLLVLDAKGLTQ
jgi:hypothetical protein